MRAFFFWRLEGAFVIGAEGVGSYQLLLATRNGPTLCCIMSNVDCITIFLLLLFIPVKYNLTSVPLFVVDQFNRS